MKINLLLVEDDPVWRKMLARFLDNEVDLRVIHAVETKEEAVAYCAGNQVDIVLMDINLTGNNLDGIQATLELSLMKLPPKVIVLTSLDHEDVILDAYTAGAIYYVSKSEFRTIPETIRSLHSTTSPQEILVKDYVRLKEAEQYNRLTAAEKEIVALSEEGIGRTEMIDKLSKSEGTLKNQISHILRKFQAKSLKEVIRTVKSRGLDSREPKR